MKESATANRLLGAHMSIEGGLYRALERGESIGCGAVQLFTRNNSRWAARDLMEAEISLFRRTRKKSGIGPVFAHGSYLINLASPGPFYDQSVQALVLEVQRAHQLGLEFVVLHPGAHKGAGEKDGLRLIVEALDRALEQTPGRVAIENTAGQGSCVGCDIKHLSYILQNTKYQSRVGVCIDTCHLFASGYDFRTREKYSNTFQMLLDHVPLKRIWAFHLNDSKKPLGSRVDRHEHIGKGHLGVDAFRLLLNDDRFERIPKVLETPKGKDLAEDIENLNLLRSL